MDYPLTMQETQARIVTPKDENEQKVRFSPVSPTPLIFAVTIPVRSDPKKLPLAHQVPVRREGAR